MNNHIYVFCPYGVVTGGPDALHQIVFYLNSIKPNFADIVYYGEEIDRVGRKALIPSAYKRYVTRYLLFEDISDTLTSSIVTPEIFTSVLKRFKNAKKYIWWLSVEHGATTAKDRKRQLRKKVVENLGKYLKRLFSGYYFKNKGKISATLKQTNIDYHFEFNEENERGVKHLCASYYAFDFVSNRAHAPVEKLIEPISKTFLEKGMTAGGGDRRKVVLYNPKKGADFSALVIKKAKRIHFQPLTGLTWEGLIEQYRTAVLYMDFGPFPGAERMPKEAVYNGCLVITGRNGASAYHGDVPIPEEDKFDTSHKNVRLIIKRIEYMLEHYSELVHDFDEYRLTVENLEPNFIKQLKNIFLSKE